MWRWFKWVLIGILVIIIMMLVYTYWRLVYNVQFHGQELAQAEKTIAAGITIIDQENDFVIMEQNGEKPNENNPSPYRLPVVDIKKMQVGSDGKYLYIKITFYDSIPKSAPSVNGDKIEGLGAKIDFLDKPLGNNLAVLHLDFGWWPILNVPVANVYYSTGPTGIEWPESARFTTENRDSKISGGAGYDYILAAYPLKTLKLKSGDTINIDMQTEAKSAKWDHAAVDVLQGKGKMPGLISWVIGSGNYSIDNEEHYFSDH